MKKLALITGASSGIGRELAFEFAKNGYDLVLVARRKDRLEEAREQLTAGHNVDVTVIEQDLSHTDSAEVLFETFKKNGVMPDVLINNAGFGLLGSFEQSDTQMEEQMILLNILTLTKLTKLFGQQMAANQGGDIINIASTAAFQPVPFLGVYAATKAYVLNFSRAIDFEWRKKNVRVLTVCPGATQSEFGAVAGFDVKHASLSGSVPDSKELAFFIFNAMKAKKSLAIHGFINSLLIFLQRFTPGNLAIRMAASIMNR